ncbi:MAG TPA: N-acetylmuramoyl-L-alanine amidase [Rhodanobacteraceae bacterium]|nr:N-acetylmuramoyl-L-alanine amidase [Rhodanobacteraceae bacterium]
MWGGPPTIRLIALGAATLLAASGVARAADIENLRIWAGPEYTRAVFDVSGPADYKLFELSKPDRIVLDVHASTFADRFGAPPAKGLLKGIRAGKQGKDDARIVFDLAEGVRPKSFLLPPADKFGYRLVLDLYPASEKAKPVKSVAEPAPGKTRDVVVAVDAGHGGDDPGATGSSGTHEKDITLAVARQLKKQIDRTPGMSAVLTRDGDYFIPLEKRYAKARDEKADLFVSIHADAFKSSDAKGSSVWVLSPRGATNEAARWLADRENRADLVGGVSLDDKDDTLAAVLLDLSQGATMGASNAVAEQVLTALRRLGPTHRGYVERANFVVLRSPDVPSILVETAFITNPTEEAKLKNPDHREKLASAILDGVNGYFRASPPPGTYFAASSEPARRKSALASRYVVNRGDTLSKIAEHHGLSIAQLREANDLDEDRVRPGEVLQIPPG